jgi:protein Mpv17
MISVTLGNGIAGVEKKIEHHLVGTQLTAWMVWIPAQYANFYLMPLHMRVIFVQFIALFWNTYMAWKVMLRVPDLEDEKPE